MDELAVAMSAATALVGMVATIYLARFQGQRRVRRQAAINATLGLLSDEIVPGRELYHHPLLGAFRENDTAVLRLRGLRVSVTVNPENDETMAGLAIITVDTAAVDSPAFKLSSKGAGGSEALPATLRALARQTLALEWSQGRLSLMVQPPGRARHAQDANRLRALAEQAVEAARALASP